MADREPLVDSPLAEKDYTQTVVIAMDGSEFSDYALQFYADCLHRPENNVWLVHVTEYKIISQPALAIMSGSTDMSLITKEIEAEEKKTTELFDHLKQKISFLKLNAHIESVHGDVGPSIITFASEKNADFVVVGCRGKGKIRRTFTGSVADYITHHSHVPVVIARNSDHLEKLHIHSPFKLKKQ
ncbi:universal stress protein Slr1101-like [Ruditapes philippinarum]|uniref:universal stress protein Slr1101-like n=1 Tax=Ruditapes philippinarum TaxID=129788 RepID=UPI00295BC987|nr:universal stress protein Slr1101-like [Ruditapes philippinarum]